jgi:hypothetical protein
MDLGSDHPGESDSKLLIRVSSINNENLSILSNGRDSIDNDD